MDVLQEQSESPRLYIKLETRQCPACKVSRAAPHSQAASTPARQACLNPTVCPLTHWTPDGDAAAPNFGYNSNALQDVRGFREEGVGVLF